MFFKNSCKIQTKTFLESQVLRKSTAAVKPKVIPSFSSDDYQYLQKSPLPTLHFQKSLLRLPIPELEKTCERYLNAVRPILNDDQFEKTKQVVEQFKVKDGVGLQELLKAKDAANKHTSYISKPWFDMYLSDRVPLPINYNPALAFSKSTDPNSDSQLCKATNFTISSLRFMKSLKSHLLAPEVFHLNPEKTNTDFFTTLMGLLPSMVASYGAYMMKAYPLDMSQYSSLFSSTRIPQLGKDILVKDESGKHILVLRNGHFFKVEVLNEEGNILLPEDIFTCFKYIIEKDLKPNKQSIGILTTENRDVWAKAREHLVSIHPDNFQSIKAVDSALFVICLDDEKLGEDPMKIMKSFLHGHGFNRWFDKSFSILISKDGACGLNFEHAWGDGVAILRYLKDVYAEVNTNPFVDFSTQVSSISPAELVKELEFNFDGKVSNYVKEANEKFNKTVNSLGLHGFQYPGLGRNICKSAKISPDALMQLSFQVAYHKVYGTFVGTYESCSTAAFKHGRTETLRPCTTATKTLALNMNSKNKPGKEELMSMIRECSEVHKNLTKEAAMGQGFDRHLFGLRHVCEETGRPLPDLYKDESFRLINHNIISTSTLSTDAISVGGFGPVVSDGLGVGYVILDNFCGTMVSSYPNNRNGADFSDALKVTFEELSSIVSK